MNSDISDYLSKCEVCNTFKPQQQKEPLISHEISHDYIGPDSMTRWILEVSDGFVDVGLLKISERIRAYAHLILSYQASARSSIVENTASTLTAQSAFLDNFENVVNQSMDIREDIKRYQETLSFASSKVDYSVGENLYVLPSDMNLKIRLGTAGYNNKILVSDGKFILGKNEKVNLTVPVMKSHKTNSLEAPAMKSTQTAARPEPCKCNSNDVLSHTQAISQKNQEPKTITHNDEKIALVLFIADGFTIWNIFR